MQHNIDYGYGLWSLVILNSVIFIFFAYSFTKQAEGRYDWHSLSIFSAFVIAYFAEMYGFPLTIYLISGWLTSHYPGIDFLSHYNGHLLHTLLGLKGDPHFDIFHILSNVLIIAGILILALAWRTLYQAQREHKLALTGLYAKVRHPQYDAFILIMIGFLLQWPTLITLVMFPILVIMYVRLAHREENKVRMQFGEDYSRYAEITPAFVPRVFG